jgi:hypothetical protein
MWFKGDFKKNAAEDTISAMVILERGLKGDELKDDGLKDDE